MPAQQSCKLTCIQELQNDSPNSRHQGGVLCHLSQGVKEDSVYSLSVHPALRHSKLPKKLQFRYSVLASRPAVSQTNCIEKKKTTSVDEFLCFPWHTAQLRVLISRETEDTEAPQGFPEVTEKIFFADRLAAFVSRYTRHFSTMAPC